MVLNAEDLSIHAMNSAYQELLGGRNIIGLPFTEVFGGKDTEELIRTLTVSAKNAKAVNTPPLVTSVGATDSDSRRFVHTIVSISDASGSTIINRLFVYSEAVGPLTGER
jgi:hypothetical protein